METPTYNLSDVALNYKHHIHFSEDRNSKEYALDKCMKILGLIAQVKDRMEVVKRYSGTNDTRFITYGKTISRLKKYYNYALSNVVKFDF